MGTVAGGVHVALAGLIVQPVTTTPDGRLDTPQDALAASAVAAALLVQVKLPP